jgi:hypothetical protein
MLVGCNSVESNYVYCNTIRQVQATEDNDHTRRKGFSNWFLQALHDGVLDPKLAFIY